MLKITGKSLFAEELLAEELKKKGFIVEGMDFYYWDSVKSMKGKINKAKWYVTNTVEQSGPDGFGYYASGPFNTEDEAYKYLKKEIKDKVEQMDHAVMKGDAFEQEFINE